MSVTRKIELKAEVRPERGKEWAKKARKAGLIPGVVYGEGGESVAITLDRHDFMVFYEDTIGEQTLIPLELSNGKTEKVFVKDLQREPVSDAIIHVDLLRIDVTHAVQLPIRVKVIGEKPVGVKEGGILERIHDEVNVEALPDKIPGHIEIDLSGLDINETFTVGMLPQLEGVTYLDDPESALYSVVTQAVEPEPEAEEGDEPKLVGEGEEEGKGGKEE